MTGYELQLNSIGDENCRPAYLERLNAWLDEHDDVLDDEARQKRATSPLRVFDVKNEAGPGALRRGAEDRRRPLRRLPRALRAGAPVPRRTTRSSTRSCRRSFAGSTTTRARPSSSSDEAIGAQSSIFGGGRYDWLIEEIGGAADAGVGFGAGIERLLLSLEAAGVAAGRPGLDVFVAC